MLITPARTSSTEGQEILSRLLDRFQLASPAVQSEVTEILKRVRTDGDEALTEYTRKFDAPDFQPGQLRVSKQELDEAYKTVSPQFQKTLDLAIDRIQSFHAREKAESWVHTRDDGAITGRLVTPVPSAGLYVPGGKSGETPLVSSVLMNGIPAAIAGVGRLVMVSPPTTEGNVSPALLVAAQEIGISEVYKAGSAWAIAALAYGTETIPQVDVIVGPGNQYVTEAKRQVAGRVRIDMIAGPSEILVIADSGADPEFIAADMLSQAEHDPQALAILITTDGRIAGQVVSQLEEQIDRLDRRKIAHQSLRDRGAILIAEDLEEAVSLANRVAAEHLELMVTEPYHWLTRITHAGAIFVGSYSPEAVGDYIAGPNHVLPTMGTARFSSSLGVDTFQKKSNIISYSKEAFEADAADVQRLAKLEGLTGHARSVEVRLRKTK